MMSMYFTIVSLPLVLSAPAGRLSPTSTEPFTGLRHHDEDQVKILPLEVTTPWCPHHPRHCREGWRARISTVAPGTPGAGSLGGQLVGVGQGGADDLLQGPRRAVAPQLVVAVRADGGPRGTLDALADLLHQRGAAEARADALPQHVRRPEQPGHALGPARPDRQPAEGVQRVGDAGDVAELALEEQRP